MFNSRKYSPKMNWKSTRNSDGKIQSVFYYRNAGQSHAVEEEHPNGNSAAFVWKTNGVVGAEKATAIGAGQAEESLHNEP
jgi:hypothetical protein